MDVEAFKFLYVLILSIENALYYKGRYNAQALICNQGLKPTTIEVLNQASQPTPNSHSFVVRDGATLPQFSWHHRDLAASWERGGIYTSSSSQ